MADQSVELQQQVEQAYQQQQPLAVTGGGSKAFYGRPIDASPLHLGAHTGIIHYEPTELVITARAGTPLRDIETALAQHQQMLAFEPPCFGDTATLGGTVACNLSGPRRASRGAVRDYVLGCRIINGKGEVLKFGGEVMKNVAGYDVSRLMCGAMGTLGVLLDVSLKVIPVPEAEITQVLDLDMTAALQLMYDWGQKPLPISATCFVGDQLYVRLSGHESEIRAAAKSMGGEELADNQLFWNEIKEQKHAFFKGDQALWRLSLAATTQPLKLEGESLYEWGGALRWLRSDESADKIRHALELVQGHATLFRNNHAQLDPFHELSPAVFRLNRALKLSMDPAFILNPGRMYVDI